MRAVALSGSPRKKGNTVFALQTVLDVLADSGIETELHSLAGLSIQGCTACGRCRQEKDAHCHGRIDDLSPILDRCLNTDILLLGSPVYFGSATPEIKCVMDRLGYPSRGAGNPLSRKLGAAIVVARRAGQNFTLAQLSYFFQIMDMMQVGSSYWNILFGKNKGDVAEDQEGIDTLKQLGTNLAFAANKLYK
jgi:multimeric flavodoxin WrbA